jgi:hypothetical protein
MVSQQLLLYCLLAAGGYLLVISLVLNFIERRLKLTQGIPSELIESSGFSWSAVRFVMEALFFVVIPSIAYSFFYLVIPVSGIRAGMAAALFAFALGAAPTLMGMSVRVSLPMPYLLFVLLSHLLKLTGSLVIISYLYSL